MGFRAHILTMSHEGTGEENGEKKVRSSIRKSGMGAGEDSAMLRSAFTNLGC